MKGIITSVILTLVAVLDIRGAAPVTFPGREAASVGIYIEDLRNGTVLADHNSRVALTPASILKSVTAATALLTLGKDFRFTTDFLLVGSDVDNGKADMVIVGGGDPTMGGREFKESGSVPDSVASCLEQLGIGSIAGKVTIDGSVLPEGGGVVPGWEVEDVSESYGAGLFPVNWMDNYFASDYVMSDPPGFFKDEVIAACGRRSISVEETYEEIFSPFAEPDTTLGATGEVLTDTLHVYSHRSERLERIMKVMMEKSVNLIAEGCLRATAPHAPTDTALAREKALWKARGVDLDRSRLLDGSGLARGNAVAPRQIAEVLKYMAGSEEAATYTALFPRAGREGTVKSLLAGTRLAGRLAVKSGSMGGVHCYAGYLLGANGRPTHTVVVMVNNFFCTRPQLRKAIERYLLEILP